MAKKKAKDKKPAKLKKLPPIIDTLLKQQLEALLKSVVTGPILDVLKTLLPDNRPEAQKIENYQPTMGWVLGWKDGSDTTSMQGPICVGNPTLKEEWAPHATHFTIPVRPFSYEE